MLQQEKIKLTESKSYLGSTRVTINSAGDVVSYDDYDPWGLTLAGRSGNIGDATDKFKFIGVERDKETCYDATGPRFYDAWNGRFGSTDPLCQYPSPYIYSGNDPINLSDPSGLWADDSGMPQHWATRYYDENSKLVYDDGIDNGLDVYTTQDIINQNTKDGITDWDAVRNNEGTTTKIIDEEKYWKWVGAMQSLLMKLYDGAVKISADNKGNITIIKPMGTLEMVWMMLGPLILNQTITRLLPNFKLNSKWKNWEKYLMKREWTLTEIRKTVIFGKKAVHDGTNYLNPGNSMSIITNPKTGKSLVIDNITHEIIMLGDKGFGY